MKALKKTLLIFLTLSMVVGGFYSWGWAGEKWKKNDPNTDEWNVIDLMVARPIGVVATLFGACIFIPSLIFTVPMDAAGIKRGAVKESANILIINPWKFSFVREFPDEDM